MRINVYSQELTDEVCYISKASNTGVTAFENIADVFRNAAPGGLD